MTATEIYRVEGFEWRNTRLGRFIERYGYGCVDSLLREAAENPEPFWEAVVADIGVTWLSPYRSVLATQPHAPARGWFHGGKLNVAVDAVDKWAKSDPDRIAIAWEGGDGTSRILTTQQLMSEVSRVARGLADLGVGKGDRVAVSLPILPEAAVVMLAIARIGAVVVPLAWAAEPKLTTARLRHSGARVVFCADGFLKEGREFSTIGGWQEILPGSPSVETMIVIPRLAREGGGTSRPSGIVGNLIHELDYDSFGALASHGGEVIGLSPSDPFILSYASSSSGARESLIHTHLGFVIKTCQDMAMSFDVQARDCVMWLAEFDWTSGTWLVFGALALGASLVLIEDPAGRPDIDRTWVIAERRGVTHLALSANVARRLMSADTAAIDAHDLSRLRILGTTGENWDEAGWRWLFSVVGNGKRPVVRHSAAGGTSGGILGSFAGLPMKVGGFSGPLPGVSAEVWDRDGRPARGEIGDLVILKPWPWMTRRQLESTDQRTGADRNARIEYWFHGTSARIDRDGFWFDHGISEPRGWRSARPA